MILKIVFYLLGWETFGWFGRVFNRQRLFRMAQIEARRRGKPLLVVGCPSAMRVGGPLHPCGDVTVDIRSCPVCPDARQANVEALPFEDKAFGAVFVGHVLEEVGHPVAAWEELHRVADRVFVAFIPPAFLAAVLTPGVKNVIFRADQGGFRFRKIA